MRVVKWNNKRKIITDMEKILTIVIPTYNMQDYLRRCLDSLIVPEEQMKQLEVLVINDGSKDNSSAIAHEYQDRYPDTFRVIDKENGNYGSCVNRGLKEATGKYIKILDADDYFDTENLASFLNFLRGVEEDLVISDYCIVDESGNITSCRTYKMPENKALSFYDYCNNVLHYIQMHAVTYNRHIFDGLEYHQTEGISYTDQEWIFLPMSRVKTFVYFNQALYMYFIGRQGQTMDAKVMAKHVSHIIQIVKNGFEALERCDLSTVSLKTYLYDQLAYNIGRVYNLAIRRHAISTVEAIDFDRYVRANNVEIYNKMASSNFSRKIPFHYISYWRKHKKLPFLLKIFC